VPWTGDFTDGLGNKISMMAYANPPNIADAKQRADGVGIARFRKKARTVTFECWPRFGSEQFAGWPLTVEMDKNDGRKPVAWLPKLVFEGAANAVVQVVEEKSGEVLYTVRSPGASFQPPVFKASETYAVKVGRDKPTQVILTMSRAHEKSAKAGVRKIQLA